MLTSVFELGNLTAAGVALEKGSGMLASALIPGGIALRLHAEFRTLMMRADCLSIAC